MTALILMLPVMPIYSMELHTRITTRTKISTLRSCMQTEVVQIGSQSQSGAYYRFLFFFGYKIEILYFFVKKSYGSNNFENRQFFYFGKNIWNNFQFFF